MIEFTRTSSIAPGKVAEALAFAKEMSEYVQKKFDRKLQVMMPIGGNPHRIAWRSTYPSLALMEEFQTKTLADPQYLSILSKAATLFVPASAHDDIWRAL